MGVSTSAISGGKTKHACNTGGVRYLGCNDSGNATRSGRSVPANIKPHVPNVGTSVWYGRTSNFVWFSGPQRAADAVWMMHQYAERARNGLVH